MQSHATGVEIEFIGSVDTSVRNVITTPWIRRSSEDMPHCMMVITYYINMHYIQKIID